MVIGIVALVAAIVSAVICACADGFGSLAWLWMLPVGWLGAFVGVLLLVFLLVLKCTKIIALSSILSAGAVVVYALVTGASLPVVLALLLFAALILVRHKANLARMRRREENKVSWI
jgi:glycerol-3-phosphate acyltransferase PlsY